MASYRRKGRGPLGANKRSRRGGMPNEPEKRSLTPEERLLETAKDRFRQASEADEKQRQRELDDIRFYNGEQWPEDLRIQREGQAALGNLPPVPARPTLTINKVLQPVAQVLNQERAMDMGAELIPADDFESLVGTKPEDEIELREGLLRRIQRAPETKDARTWAFERAAIAGRGYWAVMTRFVNVPTTTQAPSLAAWDQDIYVHRFYNQASVTLDPFHEQPDGSDAEYGFVGNYLPWEQYKAEFPHAANGKENEVIQGYDDDEDFIALGEQEPGWFQVTNDTRVCRVVDYYYIDRETRELALLEDGSVQWKDTLPEGVTPKDTRIVIEKKVKWAKLDGRQILDEGDWPGPDIPIVKVVGRELQPANDQDRRLEGLVRPMRDAGQALNYMVSKGVETIGLAPIPPWMIAAGQDEGYEQEYLLSTTRTLPALHYNLEDANGRPFPSIPQRTPAQVDIQPIFASIGLFGEFIKDTTLTPAAAMGDTDATHKSGKALKLQIEQSQRGTSNFLDNQARSIRREGQIINGLLYPIYGLREGRLARIMTSEGDSQTILLGQPFVTQGGRPQPAPQGTPNAKHYTLTPDATFNIVVKVSKSYDTRREQEAATVGSLIEANPALMGVIGDLFFKNLDGPGHNEMADRVKATLVPPVQQMIAEKEQGQSGPNPEMQAAQQQIQQLQQALQQAQQEAQSGLAAKQLDAQTRLQIAQMDNQTRKEIALLNAQTTMAQTGAETETARADTLIDAETRRLDILTDAQTKRQDAILRDKGSLRDTLAATDSQQREHAHQAGMGAANAGVNNQTDASNT